MTTTLTFVVYGAVASQGSKTAFINRHTGRPGMKESGEKKLKPWRNDVAVAAVAAREAVDHVTVDGPVRVEITFFLARPKSAPRRIRLPWTGLDVDKCARAVLDSLTSARVYRDDNRVTDLIVRKRFGGEHLGARISVTAIDEATFELVQVEAEPAAVQTASLFDEAPLSADVETREGVL